MSDGLTVPFALAAGLSGALATSSIIVTAGLAEIAAGAIAMGLGGYLAGRTDTEHYRSELEREKMETETMPEAEAHEVAEIFRSYQIPEPQIDAIVKGFRSDKKRWVDFMMRFELGLEEPHPGRARRSAVTIALSYIAGGIIPLVPYTLTTNIPRALFISSIFTTVALFLFGAVKAHFTGIGRLRGGLQTLGIGGAAACAAFFIARALG